MTERFDPYHAWLGIRPQDQLPTHYQLLGLQCFEKNPETIQNAADRQIAYLRTLQTGEHSALSQKLLNEVKAAAQCLLMPNKKAAYDASLQRTLEKPAFDASIIDESWLNSTSVLRKKKLPPKKVSVGQKVAMIGGGSVAVMLIIAVAWIVQCGSVNATGKVPSKSTRQVVVTTKPSQQLGSSLQNKPESPASVKTQNAVTNNTVLPDTTLKSATAAVPKEKATKKPVHPSVNKTRANNTKTVAKLTNTKEKSLASPKTEKPRENSSVPPKTEKPKDKLPIPSIAVQNEIAKQINELCGTGETNADKTKLVKQLMNLAESSQKPDERFVIRRKVAELACDSGQLPIMRQAIESIAAEFKIDAMMVESKLFDRHTTIEGTDELLRRAIRDDRYDVAMNVLESANRMCQKSSSAGYRKDLRQKQVEVERLREQWREASVAMKTLETAPDDSSANGTAGRWFWFQKGDVQQGLAYLSKGSDDSLKRLARRELAEQPTESNSQLKLADAWWGLAQTKKGDEKDRLMLHAAEWYEEVNPTLPGGLTKVRIEKRLEDVAILKRSLAKLLTPLPVSTRLQSGGILPASRWTDLLALVNVKRDGIGENWQSNENMLATKKAVKQSTVMLPVIIDGDYDLEVRFTRNSGGDAVAIIFQVGSNPCLLTFSESSGKASRLAINSKLSPPQQGNRIHVEPSVLTNKQKYAILVTVRLKGEDATVQVCLDGSEHLCWSGKQKAVSTEGWAKLPAKQMAIGANDAVAFHSIRVRPISGKATLAVPSNK